MGRTWFTVSRLLATSCLAGTLVCGCYVSHGRGEIDPPPRDAGEDAGEPAHVDAGGMPMLPPVIDEEPGGGVGETPEVALPGESGVLCRSAWGSWDTRPLALSDLVARVTGTWRFCEGVVSGMELSPDGRYRFLGVGGATATAYGSSGTWSLDSNRILTLRGDDGYVHAPGIVLYRDRRRLLVTGDFNAYSVRIAR